MKHISKIILSAFTLIMVFSLISTVNVNATGTSNKEVEVSGDSIQTQLKSNDKTTFLFRERTQLTIFTDIEMALYLNCETLRIGEKDFIIEIEGEHNLQMIMTCTREEQQLGLINGNTFRMRNQHTYRYQEGFCVSIECVPECDCICECQNECQCPCDCICECQYECQCPCDCICECENECQCPCDCTCECQNECQCSCDCECQCQNECYCTCNCDEQTCFMQARLRIRATNENREGSWAYYDESSEEWVMVPTTIEDGYLTTETDHFSTWTVLVPTVTSSSNTVLIIGGSATVAVIGVLIGGSIIYLKKREI
ncbi:MAG: hypothetical protein ACFFBK_12560 [Promethearchaeota archaeon]